MRARATAVLLLTACGLTAPIMSGPGGGVSSGGGSASAGGGDSGGGTAGAGGGSSGGSGGLGGTVSVDTLVSGRSRLGARSASGFRPWRGGLAVIDPWLYWVESGTAPGLYRMPLAGCGSGTCPEKVATLTRPSAFAAASDAVLVADVTALRRYPVSGSVQNLGSGSSELVTLATDGATAFWTTESSPINRTPFGGTTSVPINSNGTPWAMTVAGTRVHWVGVDISGLQVAMQSMKTDGTNARADQSFSGGFQTLRGDGAFLLYARDFPSMVYRQTLSNARLEQVGSNAQGVKDFAIDPTHAYWVEPGDVDLSSGLLRRVSHESTTAADVVGSLAYPVAVAVKDGVIYVLSAGTSAASWSDGRVLRITIH